MKRPGLFAPRTLLTICLVSLASLIVLAVTPPVIGGVGCEGGEDLIREDEVLFDFIFNRDGSRCGGTAISNAMPNGEEPVVFEDYGRAWEIRSRLLPMEAVAETRTVASATNHWFADDFEDGVIDPTVWQVGGDGVSESGGVLTIFRNAGDDSLTTVSAYEKALEIVVDIRITQMEWHDPFHGILFKDDSNHGISFGFVKYGTFFLAQHEGGATKFYYYSPYTMNQWYRWRLVKSGGTMDIYVDDVWICSGSVPDGSRISFPGYYNDGGSGSGSSSELDTFSVSRVVHRVHLPMVMRNP